MRKLFIFLPLLLYSAGFAMDPPSILWAKSFFPEEITAFRDVHETTDGGFIVAGTKSPGFALPSDSCLFRFSETGELLWAAGIEDQIWETANWVEELSDGSFLATGACRDIEGATNALFLLKTDSMGNELWLKMYDIAETNDQGKCVVPLEDGFAIAGDQGDKAWIIRTDLQGDSLWSATHEKSNSIAARRILQVDNTLIVFYTGVDVGILAYSIDDGQLLWEMDSYPGSFLSPNRRGDITHSSSDDGFTFVTGYFPQIAHTDSQGNLLWYYEIPYHSQPYGYSINNTMDGGYIYGGENTPNVEPPPGIQAGMVVKYDSEGNEQWRDYVYETADVKCIRQLSSGGYIACGGDWSARLIRYEPETGIAAGEDVSASLITALTPNPFSSTLNIGYNLVEASYIELSVFDLSGRLIADVEQDFFPAGEHSSAWAPDGISSGCYLVRLSTPEGCYVKNCVFIP